METDVDYNVAVQKYIDLRDENKRLADEAEKKIAENKAVMEKLGIWIELKAQQDGLDKVPTKYGTVFWTEGARCNVVNSEAFFDFVKENEAWELMEKRASKTGVRDYIGTNKQVPPGVDYTTFRQINVRAK